MRPFRFDKVPSKVCVPSVSIRYLLSCASLPFRYGTLTVLSLQTLLFPPHGLVAFCYGTVKSLLRSRIPSPRIFFPTLLFSLYRRRPPPPSTMRCRRRCRRTHCSSRRRVFFSAFLAFRRPWTAERPRGAGFFFRSRSRHYGRPARRARPTASGSLFSGTTGFILPPAKPTYLSGVLH